MAELTFDPIDWRNSPFNYPGMVKVPVIPDGSSLLHSIAAGYFTPYRYRKYSDGTPFDRSAFIINLRSDLADKLNSPVNPAIETSPTYYDILGGGALKELGLRNQKFSIESLQATLKSTRPLGPIFFEYIGDSVNKDLYFLDEKEKDVFSIENLDEHMVHKGRDSIVLLYNQTYVNLVGICTRKIGVKTLFSPDHPFIQAIKGRIKNRSVLQTEKTQEKNSNE